MSRKSSNFLIGFDCDIEVVFFEYFADFFLDIFSFKNGVLSHIANPSSDIDLYLSPRCSNNEYRLLLETNVTKGYKKAPESTEENITAADKAIATKLN